jgi:hypothetical protein
MLKLACVSFVLLAASYARADELPDMPAPKAIVQPHRAAHPFWDRANKVEATAMVGLAAFDLGQTCHNLTHGGREDNLTQSCPKDIAITVGIDAAALGAAWVLHRTGHHRLERIPMLWKVGDSISGIVYSKVHGAW